MIYFQGSYSRSKRRKADFLNYKIKLNLKRATDIDASTFVKEVDLYKT